MGGTFIERYEQENANYMKKINAPSLPKNNYINRVFNNILIYFSHSSLFWHICRTRHIFLKSALKRLVPSASLANLIKVDLSMICMGFNPFTFTNAHISILCQCVGHLLQLISAILNTKPTTTNFKKPNKKQTNKKLWKRG